MIEFVMKNICCSTDADCHSTESFCSATKRFSHKIKQLLHQYHKILAPCNIKGELTSSFSLSIARSQYFVVLMQELINIVPLHHIGLYGIKIYFQSERIEKL